jgi:hypothetical protein
MLYVSRVKAMPFSQEENGDSRQKTKNQTNQQNKRWNHVDLHTHKKDTDMDLDKAPPFHGTSRANLNPTIFLVPIFTSLP